MAMIIIGVLVGILLFLFMAVKGIPRLSGDSGAQLGLWRAIVIIFVIILIILAIMWMFGYWEPFFYISQAFGQVGESISKATGGWYPTKNIRDVFDGLGFMMGV